jgi:hypothetical protein
MAVAPKLTEWTYVIESDRDRPAEEQTQFRLRPLTYSESIECNRGEFRQNAAGEVVYTSDRFGHAAKILFFGLMGWENFRDSDGNVVEFRRMDRGGKRVIPEELLTLIQPWAIELANAITEHAELTKEASKNST